MSELNTSYTFAPGDTVDHVKLNNIIDQAYALTNLISDQGGVAAAATDYLLILRPGSPPTLQKATVTSLGAGTVTSFSAGDCPPIFTTNEATPTTTPALAFVLTSQVKNTVFAGRPDAGANMPPTFRTLVPADMQFATVAIALHDADCTLGNVFSITLPTGTGPYGLNVKDLADGQTIKVNIINNATGNNKVTWASTGMTPTIVWRGTGPAPVLTQLSNARDVFTFTRISGLTYGYADQHFTT